MSKLIDTPDKAGTKNQNHLSLAFLERILRLTMRSLNAPVAFIALEESNQLQVKACQGLDLESVDLTSLHPFVTATLSSRDMLTIPDVSLDPRFSKNPLVENNPPYRFYAGITLSHKDGRSVGSLSIMDLLPRVLSEREIETLQDLADLLQTELNRTLEAQEATSPTKKPDESNGSEFSQAFEQHLKMDYLISQLSYKLIHFVTTGKGSVIDEALQTLGEAFGVDRSYMVFLDENKIEPIKIYQWCAPDIPPQRKPQRNLKPSNLKRWVENLNHQGASHISQIAELPSEAVAEKRYMQEHGMRSYIAVPLVYSRSPLGFLSLDSVQSERIWTDVEVATLKVVGEILANALEHRQTEEALQESNERFKALVQNSTDVTGIVTPEGIFQYLSPSVEKVWGYKAEELVGKNGLEFIHPEDVETITTELMTLLQEPYKAEPLIYRFRHANGNYIYVESIAQNLVDNPNIRGIVANTRDITRRKQREEVLRENQAWLQLLLAATPALLFGMEAEGGFPINYMSENCQLVVGYEAQEFLKNPKYWEEHIHPDDTAKICDQMSELFEKNYLCHEYRFLHQDGTYRWLYNTLRLAQSENGNPRRIFGSAIDITERKKAEEELRQSEAKNRALLDVIPDMLFRINREGTFLEIRAQNDQELMMPREVILGKKLVELFSPEEAELALLYIEQVLNTKQLEVIEYEMPKEEEQGHFEARVIPCGKDEILAIVRDITDRKKAEKILKHRINFEKLVATISASFINLTPQETNAAINQALEAIGTFYGADRCYIYLIPGDNNSLSNIYEWCLEGITSHMDFLKEASLESVSYWLDEIRLGNIINLSHTQDLKDELFTKKELLKWQEIKSLLVIPLVYGQQRLSFIELDSATTERIWTEEEVVGLKVIGEIFINALKHLRIEKELRESEERYRFLAENASDLMVRTDSQGNLTYVSPASQTILGYEPHEILGHNALEFFSSDEMHRIIEPLRNSPDTITTTVPVLRKDQSIVWIEVAVRSLLDPQTGTLQQAVAVGRDISERKKYEEALKESEAQYRLLAENSNDIITRATLQGVYIYISPASRTMLGYEPEEMLGHSWDEIIHPDDLVAILEASATILKQDARYSFAYRVRHKDGHYLWIETTSNIIRDPQTNQPIEVQASSRDITKRKQGEEALRESEELYHSLFDNNLYGVLIANPNGEIIAANPAACQILGYSEKEIIALGREGLLDQKDPNLPEYMEKRRSSKTSYAELNHVRKDGKIILCEISRNSYMNKNGQERSCVIIKDISERQKMEEERRKNSNLESLGVLAGGIAHDYNNILTAIMGNISLARASLEATDELDNLLDAAEKATFRARELTQQLLTFAKGGAPIKKMAQLEELIRDTIGFILRGSNVRSELDLPSGLWPIEIDRGQISQVLQNLVLNSIQAMPRGGVIWIEARNSELAEDEVPLLHPGRYLKITVRDHGSGIKPKDLPRIFDPYFTTKAPGNGLGLAICYSVIKKHGGQLVVESEWEKGTSAHIYLPIIPGTVPDLPSPEAIAVPKRQRILVMDDDEMVRTLLSKLLQKL
ncbi:MAG: PAS domain S-box protein, partial [Chloroflexota bacterium]